MRAAVVIAALVAPAVAGTPFPAPVTTPAAVNHLALSDNADDAAVQFATDRRGRWIAVWASESPTDLGLGTDADILCAVSTDDGATWSAATPVNTDADIDDADDHAPDIATDRRGDWIVTWHATTNAGNPETDIWCAVSRTDGNSWRPPQLIDPAQASDSGDDFLPRIITDTVGTWIVAWQTRDSAPFGPDEDILVTRSEDGGESWSAPQPLNADAATDAADDVNVAIDTDAHGRWIAVWQSDLDVNAAGTDDDILISRSDDFGVTWTNPTPIADNATTDAAHDFNPGITTDGQCNWLVAWHSPENLGGINTDYDIFRVASNDNGLTWSGVAALNANAGTDSGPDYAVTLANDRRGNWIAAWSAYAESPADPDAYLAHSSDGGATWSDPLALASGIAGDERPIIGSDRQGRWLVAWSAWNAESGAAGLDRDILSARFTIDISEFEPGPLAPPIAVNDAVPDIGADTSPAIVADGEISWFAAWSSTEFLLPSVGPDADIFFSRSTDNADEWEPPIVLSTPNDSGDDRHAAIDFDGDCTLVIAWSAGDGPFGGPADSDIAFVRSIDHGLTWTTAAALSENPIFDAGDDGAFDVSLATDGAGVWIATWDSNADGDLDIHYAVSTDNGASWGPTRLLNSNGADDEPGDADTYCRIATNTRGRWIAVWDSFDDLDGTIDPDRDILFAVSNDDGATWTDAAPAHDTAASDVGFDSLAHVASDGDAAWMIVWQSTNPDGGVGFDADILFVRSTNNGATWSSPAPVNTNASTDLGFDSEPRVETDGTGNWVVAWVTTSDLSGMIGPDNDIAWTSTANLGATWTDPAPLNIDADTDNDFDRGIALAANGAGTWVATWESDGALTDPLGPDFDILAARFPLAPRCPGDADADQDVDFDDLNAILFAWSLTDTDPGFDPQTDLIPDGAINFADLNEVLTSFGARCD